MPWPGRRVSLLVRVMGLFTARISIKSPQVGEPDRITLFCCVCGHRIASMDSHGEVGRHVVYIHPTFDVGKISPPIRDWTAVSLMS